MLLQKRQIYLEEMSENEHLQKQMEICGQGLEMRLHDQGFIHELRVQMLYLTARLMLTTITNSMERANT